MQHIIKKKEDALLHISANLLCQATVTSEHMGFMKLCLPKTVNMMNCNCKEIHYAELDVATYHEMIEECEKRRTLSSSSVTVQIDNLFEHLLECRFDKNVNRTLYTEIATGTG